MAIVVVCTKCRARFQVNDKFAGRKGPCPKCKAEITIPKKSEEVVVHAPETFGPKDAEGRSTLKPIFREETKWSPLAAGIIAFAVVVAFALAFALRPVASRSVVDDRTGEERYRVGNELLLSLGALLVAVPLAYGAYSFVRSIESEPFRGKELWLRTAICGVAYAAVWGLSWGVNVLVYGLEGGPWGMVGMPFVIIVMLGIGGGIAHVTLDLEYGSGLVHCSLYFLVTVLLRLTMGLSAA